jgi:uncharacterized protein (TIGR00297 family)
MLLQFGLGTLLAILIAAAARKTRSLSLSGACAAVVLGAVIFGLGGLSWAILLLVFFISSSLLSRLFKRRKITLDEKFSKGAERDAAQVLANGGIAGLFAIAHIIFPNAYWPWVGCAAALAAANADTWATELGVLNPFPPVLITTGRPVERGTSGGISLAGTLAALSGSALIAFFAVLFWQSRVGMRINWFSTDLTELLKIAPVIIGTKKSLLFFILLSLSGLFGSLVDSLLGATLQAIYYCPNCAKETERHPLHSCGQPTRLLRGLNWLDNDWVNAACTLSSALIALAILRI